MHFRNFLQLFLHKNHNNKDRSGFDCLSARAENKTVGTLYLYSASSCN